jgi:hypothetical protein
MTSRHLASAAAAAALLAACAPQAPQPAPAAGSASTQTQSPTQDDIGTRLARYRTVRLTTDISQLTPNERRMLPLLIDAAKEMDAVFWMQSYGSRDSLFARVADPRVRQFADMNYGPWDRLENDQPFVPGIGAKPEGANYYPREMTRAEFDAEVARGGARADSLKSLYTLVRRDASGRLYTIPFHVAYAPYLQRAADKLRQAAALADDPGLKQYLTLRAAALLSDDFQPSDLAWMDMKNNTLDVVIGPIETYEDALYGYKAANEAYVLVKDREWSRRLAHYVQLLPALQRGLPVEEQFKREVPGSNSDLNAYDAVYYAGQANSGAKTIAINLPNDEQVQLQKGTRRLQLKNAMRAKFDAIMLPIGRELIVPDQVGNITFDGFFENTMFHEVAHGLGIKNVVNGTGTVREALKERAGGLEEEKADVLGLYMVTQLNRQGELGNEPLINNYVTFLAGLFRSVRFGASDAHGRANMATFNFFAEQGAFTRDPATGKYRVNFEKMQQAVNALAGKILRLQGTGDYAGVGTFMSGYGVIRPELQGDLGRLSRLGIPVDVVFEQGTSVLGL